MSGKHHITMQERIERRVYFSIDGCWLWTGQKRNDKDGGYGLIKIDRRLTRAHRVSYETYKGPIPDGLFVCHTCDVPLCVNPDHLFVGTLQENNYDMYKKGRNAKFLGDANVRSKLKESDIPHIIKLRQSGLFYYEIAEKYNVGPNAIRDIFNKRTWSHLKLLS